MASCQKHVAFSVSLAEDALMVLAEALPLLTRTLQHPSQHATMLLILGRVTLCGSACNVPLVTGSEFQQKAELVYPLFCCLPKCLLQGRSSVFTWHRQASSNLTLF